MIAGWLFGLWALRPSRKVTIYEKGEEPFDVRLEEDEELEAVMADWLEEDEELEALIAEEERQRLESRACATCEALCGHPELRIRCPDCGRDEEERDRLDRPE